MCSENPTCAEVQGNLWELTKKGVVNHKALALHKPVLA